MMCSVGKYVSFLRGEDVVILSNKHRNLWKKEEKGILEAENGWQHLRQGLAKEKIKHSLQQYDLTRKGYVKASWI